MDDPLKFRIVTGNPVRPLKPLPPPTKARYTVEKGLFGGKRV